MTAISAIPVGPVYVHDVDFDSALREVLNLASSDRAERTVVVTPNGQHLDLLRTNQEFLAAYQAAELVLPDGWPIALAMKWRGAAVGVRVTGADLLPALCAAAAEQGLSVGFLGGEPGVADRAVQILTERLPALSVGLVHAPPFGFHRDDKLCQETAELVNSSGVRLLFVGLGAPKQELFAHQWLRATGPGVCLGIGGAIDFLAGTQSRAPQVWQTMRAEWLYRLLREPRRLARRYARTIPIILRVLGEAGIDRVRGRSR